MPIRRVTLMLVMLVLVLVALNELVFELDVTMCIFPHKIGFALHHSIVPQHHKHTHRLSAIAIAIAIALFGSGNQFRFVVGVPDAYALNIDDVKQMPSLLFHKRHQHFSGSAFIHLLSAFPLFLFFYFFSFLFILSSAFFLFFPGVAAVSAAPFYTFLFAFVFFVFCFHHSFRSFNFM